MCWYSCATQRNSRERESSYELLTELNINWFRKKKNKNLFMQGCSIESIKVACPHSQRSSELPLSAIRGVQCTNVSETLTGIWDFSARTCKNPLLNGLLLLHQTLRTEGNVKRRRSRAESGVVHNAFPLVPCQLPCVKNGLKKVEVNSRERSKYSP